MTTFYSEILKLRTFVMTHFRKKSYTYRSVQEDKMVFSATHLSTLRVSPWLREVIWYFFQIVYIKFQPYKNLLTGESPTFLASKEMVYVLQYDFENAEVDKYFPKLETRI